MADLRSFARRRLVPLVRRGHRTVVWSGPLFDLGNYLYLWQRAWLRQQAGHDCRVRRNEKIQRWLPHFPTALAELDVTDAEIRFQDQRDLHHHQVFGVDFDGEQNAAFVRSVVLTSPALEQEEATDDATLTVNIRRGDYYSDPVFRGQYSLDLVAYVRTALDLTHARDGRVDHVRVVSDGIDWCRDRLAWLGDDGRSVDFLGHLTPMESFALLSRSRRLVVTNSTFSYWAAHVSTTRYADNHGLVYAPWFHRRDIDGGRSWHLDPRWSVIRDIPGGWDA